ICKSLKRLWGAITLDPVPFWPPERQTTFSIFGNPRFWRAEIMRDLPADSPARQCESFRRLVRFRALKNIKVIEADHAPMTGGMFSLRTACMPDTRVVTLPSINC